ncbi:TetR/AcrR family transcriptional regulator [uncultured Shimia sp.]|uniref:TetR/AcrR family transcriptional regulator n=1 Tax=uncultured Shimia sp. TaxID=573152 RepID=UPI00262BC629|nr:TetR/AcrR family transcriptional regulator [uncultured Shimia sp.]
MVGRLSKEDWLQAGLTQLARLGPDGLKLAHLCKVQGRTTGAFYAHFTDHAGFVKDLIAHWEKTYTDDVMAASGAKADQLASIVRRLDHRIEVAMRLYGFQNPVVAAKLAEVDEKRIGFLAWLYGKSGALEATEARAFAELEYAAFVGTQMVWQGEPIERSIAVSATFDRLVAAHLEKGEDR